ncbi:hypothetical protein [Acrocarpospora catenulata]|nr:hypothetical protein [Acrocarpospora catenulata]
MAAWHGCPTGAARLAGAAIRASEQEWVRAAAAAVIGRVAGATTTRRSR